MSARDIPIESAWTLRWERRQHPRVSVDLPVRLHLPRGDISARAVDLSAGGLRLRVMEADLCWVRPLAERSVLVPVVRMAFNAHLQLAFLERGVTVGARLARLVAPPDETDRIYLGLRFSHVLTPPQLTRLGIHPDTALAPEAPGDAPAGGPPRLGSPTVRPLTLLAEAADDPSGEASCGGIVSDVGDHLLALRVIGGDPGDLTARVAGRLLGMTVLDEEARVLAARGRLHQVRVEEKPAAVELSFLIDVDPRQPLAHLRRGVHPV